ncbi:Sulphatase-modifying factor protein [Thiorhodococcus drewsii AZ1]|uniref:Sulphatase-modifying factor protein n=1 Tax=Thiorhodococcus drewsii AZ1 TaxID=765913 RepID=G2E220_9GAMM|nr:formylglycine-generating enzyme family protein [Thiorhodococcus drewsii]EGV30969.1 Sulphatase-modifying factor protein [Thiorhodococcus drewsii AZ1]
MTGVLKIDLSWHPLAAGCPPAWASEWGEDRYGVFVAFTLEAVTQRLRWIPPGRFWMGSPEEETRGLTEEKRVRDWLEREHPRHEVYITQGFWLFDTPCTQALWEVVMGGNPSRFKTPERPVEQVSWDEAQTFIAQINSRIPNLGLSLPTEAQWEHACRAGTETALYSGPIEILGVNNAPALDPIAWYGGNSRVDFELEEGHDSSSWPEMQYRNPRSGTHPVGRKQPNPWGLYDILGNVWEWCADGQRDYQARLEVDPIGSSAVASALRVVRGGSWSVEARCCRSAVREGYPSDLCFGNLGFRCARVQGT